MAEMTAAKALEIVTAVVYKAAPKEAFERGRAALAVLREEVGRVGDLCIQLAEKSTDLQCARVEILRREVEGRTPSVSAKEIASEIRSEVQLALRKAGVGLGETWINVLESAVLDAVENGLRELIKTRDEIINEVQQNQELWGRVLDTAGVSWKAKYLALKERPPVALPEAQIREAALRAIRDSAVEQGPTKAEDVAYEVVAALLEAQGNHEVADAQRRLIDAAAMWCNTFKGVAPPVGVNALADMRKAAEDLQSLCGGAGAEGGADADPS